MGVQFLILKSFLRLETVPPSSKISKITYINFQIAHDLLKTWNLPYFTKINLMSIRLVISLGDSTELKGIYGNF